MCHEGDGTVKKSPKQSPIGSDILAGISVAFIAIPQSLAYAELAGMPPYTGLYATALPAIAAAFFASSPYLQTGPTALTSLLVVSTLSLYAPLASPQYMMLAAMLAIMVGLLRISIGLFRFGALAYLISQPVLMGFTSAAAILILTSQIPSVLGLSPPLDGIIQRATWALVHPSEWNISALIISLVTIAFILFAKRLHRLFPSVLISVVLGIVISYFLPLNVDLVGDIPAGLPAISWQFPLHRLPQLLLSALVIALIGFAEASSISRTYANQDRTNWSANQEFISQGVANLAAGFFSSFPVGASFSRSSVNRLAGAKTRWSGLATGITVLLFLPFVGILAILPRAVLGAIIIAAVLSLLKLPQLYALRQVSRPQAGIAWITFVLTLALSPRIDLAVTLGIALAIAQHLRREQQLVMDSWVYDQQLHIKPKGVLWFGSAVNLQSSFNDLMAKHQDISAVHFHLGGLGRIDFSAAVVLQQLIEDARRLDIEVELHSVPPMAKRWVERIWQDALQEEG